VILRVSIFWLRKAVELENRLVSLFMFMICLCKLCILFQESVCDSLFIISFIKNIRIENNGHEVYSKP
jgi:hypothetical protein